MARRLNGTFVRIGTPRIASGGSIKFDEIEFRGDDGQTVVWSGMSMEREVAELLYPDLHGTVYFSRTWSTIYGLHPAGEPGRFKSSYASPWMLLMSIGMLFGGLATSVFLFPILIAIAGGAGIFVCLDAGSARRMFRRELPN